MANDKDKGQRRVYVLPTELVDRIVDYQQKMGISSEVEAARRLLDEALMRRDNWRSITKRFIEKLKETRVLSDIAKDVLIGHPLVTSVHFEAELVRFNLVTGETVEVTTAGKVHATENYGETLEYEPSGFSKQIDDDDIPF